MTNKNSDHPITVKEVHEMHIFQAISKMNTPVGSRVLRQQLIQYGIDLSEATVGRWLSELSSLGLLKDHGRQGRTLTHAGEARMKRLENRNESWSHVSDLLRIYEASDSDYLIDLLKARRIIEPEIARLAALNANKDDLNRLSEILNTRDRLLKLDSHENATINSEKMRLLLAETDINFHVALAESSHSPALASMLNLLRNAEPHFPIFIEMRRHLGSRGFKEHNDITLAIFQRDEALARDLMYEHISEVLNDVSRYTSGQLNTQEDSI